MAIIGIRRINTPIDKTPEKKSKRTRIRIPQPPDRAYSLRQRDLLQREKLRIPDDRYTLHKRGIRRPMVGADPLEARAISKGQLRGTLPERIVYRYLTEKMRMVDGADFDFQSSLSGGRLEMGGLVVDFRFEPLKLIINVQGPTHKEYLRGKKDDEQRSILEDMGYKVYDLWESDIYDEYKLEDIMRRIFLRGIGGGGYELSESESIPNEDMVNMLDMAEQIYQMTGALA